MLRKHLGIVVAIACLLFFARSAFAAYGSTAEVINGSPVPSGWVITTVLSNGNWIIKDLNGGPFRAHVEVINGSPLPSGWVIYSIRSYGRYDWTITNLNGGYYGATEEIWGPTVIGINGTEQTIYVPLPSGWVVTSVLVNGHWIVKDLNGAPYGVSEEVSNLSALPSGWVISRVLLNGRWIIKNQNSAISSSSSSSSSSSAGCGCLSSSAFACVCSSSSSSASSSSSSAPAGRVKWIAPILKLLLP